MEVRNWTKVLGTPSRKQFFYAYTYRSIRNNWLTIHYVRQKGKYYIVYYYTISGKSKIHNKTIYVTSSFRRAMSKAKLYMKEHPYG